MKEMEITATAPTLNVLHVTPGMSPEWGGPAVVVSELTAELARLEIRCEIVTTHGYRVGFDQVPTSPDVPVYSFATGLPARLWTAYSLELLRFLNNRAGSFDLIHIHEVWHYPGYMAFRAARKHKLPCVLTIHGELSEWGLRQKALKKQIYRLCLLDRMLRNVCALHAITNSEKEQVLKLGFETPTFVIPNGIEPCAFEVLPDPSEFVRRFPVLKGKRVILFLGRLHPKKGLDILVRSFAIIARRYEDAVLLVVGPNECGTRENIETTLNSANLLDRTVFTGLLTGEDKLAALSCADLFVLLSHSDVLGIAVLEAMVARLPVVITEGCEFPEVSANGAGLVVEADEVQVADALGMLLSDAALRERMGHQGRKLVTKRYTWHNSGVAMANLYKSLVVDRSC